MEYIVLENAITGCQELVSTAGTESSTIGCIWKSTDAYACITDCDDCSLGMINGAATQLGYNASAVNSSTAIGASATSCCTAIALGCGATATDNGIAIGTNLTACCDEVLIGDKVIITDNTVINGSDGGCSNVVAINATATASCQVVINGLIDVSNTALNVCSEANIYAKVCCDCIDIKGCTAAVNVDVNKVAIGANATGTACSVVIGCGASVSCAGDIAIGRGATITCGIDIKSTSSEVYIDSSSVCLGNSNVSSNALTGEVLIGHYNSIGNVDAAQVVAIGSGNEINCDATGSILIGGGNTICSCLTGAILIGTELGSQYDTYASDIHDSDVVIGDASSYNKFCNNGYRYHNGCLMTGRILNCAAELPATNCDLLLYYVP